MKTLFKIIKFAFMGYLVSLVLGLILILTLAVVIF